jgi:hypothetical protein
MSAKCFAQAAGAPLESVSGPALCPRRRAITSAGVALLASASLRSPPAQASSESPLAVLDAEHARALGDRLPAGLAAWLRAVPSRVLSIYSASPAIRLPAVHPVPFPAPADGLEVIVNHLRRYTGGGIERWGLSYPVRPTGETYAVGFRFRRVYASHLEGATPGLHFAAMLAYTAPASLRGQVVLVHEPIDFGSGRRSAWVYSAAQRRVRRAPDLAYDAVSDGSEGMVTADQVDGYNGAPDRYDWVLLGLEERIVPFGTAGLGGSSVAVSDWAAPGSVQSRWLRFESRPVWVVEARLRNGASHIYPRRRFYVDPDCWTVLLEEVWSSRGTLWRLALHGITPLPDGMGPMTRYSLYHDLDAGSFFATGFDDPAQPSMRIGVRAAMSEFTPDALRRVAAQF